MANIRSAEKNIRKTAARTAHNQTVKSRMRYALEKLRLELDEYKDLAKAAKIESNLKGKSTVPCPSLSGLLWFMHHSDAQRDAHTSRRDWRGTSHANDPYPGVDYP